MVKFVVLCYTYVLIVITLLCIILDTMTIMSVECVRNLVMFSLVQFADGHSHLLAVRLDPYRIVNVLVMSRIFFPQ